MNNKRTSEDRLRLPDVHYKITKSSDGTYNVLLLTGKTWTLLESGLVAIPFCAEKYILRRHYKSYEWEHHRFTGHFYYSQDKIIEVDCTWDKWSKENNNEPDMLVPTLMIDCTEITEEDFKAYKGFFDNYLDDKNDWKELRMKYKSKCKSRLLALDTKFINCPFGHKEFHELAGKCESYQGTDKSSKEYEIIMRQDIDFDVYAKWVFQNTNHLYDNRKQRNLLYDIFDITVEAFQAGKSANSALLSAYKKIKANKSKL